MKIDVEGVHVTLSDTDILHAVDADIEPGTLVGLVGPNGAGKTTLLRTITAAISPDRGDVFVGPDDIHELSSRAASRRLATVPQDTNLDFEFTVRDVVAMGRNPHRGRLRGEDDDADAIVAHALERAQVAALADRKVTSLSGGERQRVLIARALAQNAPVLVLDEPTASLDVHHQIRTLGLVRDLVDDGRTGIAAIHDLDLAARYCDALILVGDGRVQAAGTPDSVLTADRIREVFGADAVVTRNPITGTPTVTVRDVEPVEAIDGHVHVVGGTTHASRFIPALAESATRVTVGPVIAGSQDESVATGLGLDVTAVHPYETPDIQPETMEGDVLVVPDGLSTGPFQAASGAGFRGVVEPGPETSPGDLMEAIVATLDRPSIDETPLTRRG